MYFNYTASLLLLLLPSAGWLQLNPLPYDKKPILLYHCAYAVVLLGQQSIMKDYRLILKQISF